MITDIIKIEHVKDIEFSNKLYSSLCNLVWYDYVNDYLITYSWRAAGGFVAEIRNNLLGTNDNYMDFYCSGGEGIVDDQIEELFNKNGIVLFEDIYESYPDVPDLYEKAELFKNSHPVVIAYNRNKNIDNILS
jgi:hypothetical protein